jgi:hypothetical protein
MRAVRRSRSVGDKGRPGLNGSSRQQDVLRLSSSTPASPSRRSPGSSGATPPASTARCTRSSNTARSRNRAPPSSRLAGEAFARSVGRALAELTAATSHSLGVIVIFRDAAKKGLGRRHGLPPRLSCGRAEGHAGGDGLPEPPGHVTGGGRGCGRLAPRRRAPRRHRIGATGKPGCRRADRHLPGCRPRSVCPDPAAAYGTERASPSGCLRPMPWTNCTSAGSRRQSGASPCFRHSRRRDSFGHKGITPAPAARRIAPCAEENCGTAPSPARSGRAQATASPSDLESVWSGDPSPEEIAP